MSEVRKFPGSIGDTNRLPNWRALIKKVKGGEGQFY